MRRAFCSLALLTCLLGTGLPSVSGFLTGIVAQNQLHAIAPVSHLAPTTNETSVPVASIRVRPSRTVPALLPVVDQPGINQTHRRIADEVLRSLPERYRQQLKTFRVLYSNPEQRGLAGKTVMILTGNVPEDEFRGLFIHEMGHIIDLGVLTGTPDAAPSAFRDGSEIIYQNDPSSTFYGISWQDSRTKKSTALADDFVSGYAMSDPFEDFSETLTYFILQPEMFKERAKQNLALAEKYTFMQTVVLPGWSESLVIGQHQWQGLPWDTTKLPYRWQGSANRSTGKSVARKSQ